MPYDTKLLTTGIWSVHSGFPAQISWQFPFPRNSACFLINLCEAEGNFYTLKHYALESMLKYYTVQIRGFSLFSVTPVTLSFTSPKKKSPCFWTDKWIVGRFIYTREVQYSAQKNEVPSCNSKEFHSLQDISLFPITHCFPFQCLPMRVNIITLLTYILNTWPGIA